VLQPRQSKITETRRMPRVEAVASNALGTRIPTRRASLVRGGCTTRVEEALCEGQ
jgi:hypothetical protein